MGGKLTKGKTFVIMLDGNAIAHSNFVSIANDVSLLHSLGIKDKAIRGIEERSGCEPFFPAKGLIREIEIYLELGVL